ncbi:hypothetical protein [Candidatus Sulfurimonas baltica]|uniref:Uncharacterized protein n=1 Tax=Candidatus Sulfurimonas baltica TaxID=2740404 RepID=A0A7S7RNC3_9BACT|nr:hypothetical protein [Candidatus Sulfurimonas baltica]QOY52394.1 hypothetical protein HUE88_01480 [Candidatus Sulfurimonas baltica]
MILPTKIAKAKVLSIHASDSRERKSEYVDSKDVAKAKLFNTNTPKTTPPKRDKRTFLEYRAKAIAKKEGRRESAEISMLNQSKFVC